MAVTTMRSGRESEDIYKGRSSAMRSISHIVRTWPYLLPVVVFFVGWQLFPIFLAAKVSFTDQKFLTQDPVNWIGLQNYRNLLHDRLFWDGMDLALLFTALFVSGRIV